MNCHIASGNIAAVKLDGMPTLVQGFVLMSHGGVRIGWGGKPAKVDEPTARFNDIASAQAFAKSHGIRVEVG